MTKELNNGMNIIDSRDVIARIEELQAEIEAARETAMEHWDDTPEDRDEDQTREAYGQEHIEINLFSEAAELAALLALQEEAEGYAPDWRHGSALIRDSYWITYVQDMLRDLGDLPRELPSYIEINWEKTARNIQADYTSVDFDEQTYWIR